MLLIKINIIKAAAIYYKEFLSKLNGVFVSYLNFIEK